MDDQEKVLGGYPVYGQDMGIVLLDIRVPRPKGDIGNARTFPYPVDYEIASGATSKEVHAEPSQQVLESVVSAAQRLISRGVKSLATSCGLLAVYHSQVTARLPVPTVTSSLLQIPLALRVLPRDRKLGVLTIDSHALTEAHFTGVGVSAAERERLVVAGLEGTDHFFETITGNGPVLDVATARREVLTAVAAMIEQEPEIGGLVLECTNLCVYSDDLRAQTGLPVWDAVGLVNWLHAGVTVTSP
jgi:hypothetical protein